MNPTYEEQVASAIEMHERMRPQFAQRPVYGERMQIERDGKEPVDLILHRPQNAAAPTAALLNMHGGGFTGGDAVLVESYCRMLCETLQIAVINVNYKKSPEYRFPYAIEEVCDVAYYFADHAAEYGIDPARIAVGGGSAGASLAAGAAMKAMEDGRPFRMQLLVYPCTDLCIPSEGIDPELDGLIRMYAGDAEHAAHPWVTQLHAPLDYLAGLCPAVVLTCEKDSLREQGEAYAKRLIDAGVPVVCRRFAGALHGFIEVNREDYWFQDERKSPEQAALCAEGEAFIRAQLTALL